MSANDLKQKLQMTAYERLSASYLKREVIILNLGIATDQQMNSLPYDSRNL